MAEQNIKKISQINIGEESYAIDVHKSLKDTSPQEGSTRVVTSDGIQTALNLKLDKAPDGNRNLINELGKIDMSYISDAVLGQVKFGGIINDHEAESGRYQVSASALMVDHIRQTAESQQADFSFGTLQHVYITTGGEDITGNGSYEAKIFDVRIDDNASVTALPFDVNLEGFYFIANTNVIFYQYTLDEIVANVGDWIIVSGGRYTKVDTTDAVASVNGKTGVVRVYLYDIAEAGANISFSNSSSGKTIINANIPTPDAQVQANWNQNTPTAVDYIQNRTHHELAVDFSNALTASASSSDTFTYATVNEPSGSLALALAGNTIQTIELDEFYSSETELSTGATLTSSPYGTILDVTYTGATFMEALSDRNNDRHMSAIPLKASLHPGEYNITVEVTNSPTFGTQIFKQRAVNPVDTGEIWMAGDLRFELDVSGQEVYFDSPDLNADLSATSGFKYRITIKSSAQTWCVRPHKYESASVRILVGEEAIAAKQLDAKYIPIDNDTLRIKNGKIVGASKVDLSNVDQDVHIINNHNLEVDGALSVHGDLNIDGALAFGYLKGTTLDVDYLKVAADPVEDTDVVNKKYLDSKFTTTVKEYLTATGSVNPDTTYTIKNVMLYYDSESSLNTELYDQEFEGGMSSSISIYTTFDAAKTYYLELNTAFGLLKAHLADLAEAIEADALNDVAFIIDECSAAGDPDYSGLNVGDELTEWVTLSALSANGNTVSATLNISSMPDAPDDLSIYSESLQFIGGGGSADLSNYKGDVNIDGNVSITGDLSFDGDIEFASIEAQSIKVNGKRVLVEGDSTGGGNLSISSFDSTYFTTNGSGKITLNINAITNDLLSKSW
jgi:hypothetical protein